MTKDDASKDARPGVPSASAILGEMVWLYSMSEMHRTWAIGAIHQWLMPAILHKQFKLYHRERKPVGLVTWTRQASDRYLYAMSSFAIPASTNCS